MPILVKGRRFSDEKWYNSYKSMMHRCYNKNAANYKNYGGRGIKVCKEWHNIETFEKWANSSGFKVGLTLDRIDVDGNYCPENCRWATQKEQCNNRRNTVYIEYNGEIHTISEWADMIGMKRSTFSNRYHKGKRNYELFKRVIPHKHKSK